MYAAQGIYTDDLPYPANSPEAQQFSTVAASLFQPNDVVLARQLQSASWQPLYIAGNKVERAEYLGWQHVYDFEVEQLHNYCAGGLVHHNTEAAAFEIAYHMTGLYPDWWFEPWDAPDWWAEFGLSNKNLDWEMCPGRYIEKPNTGVAAGTSNDQTRDVIQSALFGNYMQESEWGSGTVPQHCMGKITKKQGIHNCFDAAQVQHHNRDGVPDGWSQISFRSYEQDKEKLMGSHVDWGWLDEEPPGPIHSQVTRATFVTQAPIISTFTPENGATELVTRYLEDTPIAGCLVQATWDDAAHFQDPQFREQVESLIPIHEREMRTKGIPLMGSGLVFPFKREELEIDPFPIPRYWPRIGAMDWGQDHKAAFVLMAFDNESGYEYTYAAQAKDNMTISEFASMIKSMLGDYRWIPIAWPHDVNRRDQGTGKTLQKHFVDEGLNMLVSPFTNPPGPGEPEGKGGRAVEAGIMEMRDKMSLGTFKVFSTCNEWFTEQAIYHRKDGAIVTRRDDVMSASRYASQSKRFAQVPPAATMTVPVSRRGGSNW